MWNHISGELQLRKCCKKLPSSSEEGTWRAARHGGGVSWSDAGTGRLLTRQATAGRGLDGFPALHNRLVFARWKGWINPSTGRDQTPTPCPLPPATGKHSEPFGSGSRGRGAVPLASLALPSGIEIPPEFVLAAAGSLALTR